MLPYYVQYEVFQMILDARASEHSARMVAMKNATDNANQFIKDLTLEYNKMRQASITTELARNRDRPDGGRWLVGRSLEQKRRGRHPLKTSGQVKL